jgi:hypothetical protein
MDAKKNNICCPKFEPSLWDERILLWENKKFVKDKIFTLFFIPINFGSVIKKMMAKIEKSGATAQDWLGLSDHTSKWNMDLYLAVDREIPNAENVSFNGRFFSKVYEGDFKETSKWCKDFELHCQSRGLPVEKYYMWYTTCPKCAKKYGKNYVVIIGRLKD